MNRIVHDFILAELRSLTLYLLLIAALLAYVIYWAKLPIKCALYIPLLALLLVLRAWRSTVVFRNRFEALPLPQQERILREYAAPHPCYRLYMGEAHLLSNCLVCRSRRTLQLFPSDLIIVAKVQHHTGRDRIVSDLLLTCNDGKTCRLEFLGKQKDSLPSLVKTLRAWDVPFESDPNRY